MTELPPYGVIVLVVWGTVTALDLVSVPQAMLSRPLVAGTVAGWLAGDIEAGLRVGVLFECFALDVLPIGAVRYPDYGPATVVAAALAAGAPWEFGLGIGAALGRRARHARRVESSIRAAMECPGHPASHRRARGRREQRDPVAAVWQPDAGRIAGRRAHGIGTRRGRADRGEGATRPADRRGLESRRDRGRALGRGDQRRDPERRAGRSPPVADRWRGCRDLVGGAYVNGGWRAQLRLLAVQGTWNYERMLGVGMGYAAEPLLEDLKTVDPVRHSEAVVRSTEFFNCHPYLAGLALGATARAEYEAVPGPQITRLRTALCSPLGALGDELFWTGVVPALIGVALSAVVLGAGWWAIGGLLVLYNLFRLGTGFWALRTGYGAGMKVGSAIGSSWLPRAVVRVGPIAGFSIGLATPLVAAWFLRGFGWSGGVAAVALAGVGVAVTRWFGPWLTSVRFTLLAMLLLLIFRRIGL